MGDAHVLIIGAGITGLLLAQALNQHDIPFTIYERVPEASYHGKGWGLALHWALDTLLTLLPPHLQARVPETSVDPVATAKGDNGRFPFFDLSTGEVRWENLSPRRLRVSREKLTRLLMEGIDIQVRLAAIYYEASAKMQHLLSGESTSLVLRSRRQEA